MCTPEKCLLLCKLGFLHWYNGTWQEWLSEPRTWCCAPSWGALPALAAREASTAAAASALWIAALAAASISSFSPCAAQ